MFEDFDNKKEVAIPVVFTFAYESDNINDSHIRPSTVSYVVDNAEDLNVDDMLYHFSKFLSGCGYAQYNFFVEKKENGYFKGEPKSL